MRNSAIIGIVVETSYNITL